MSLNYNIQFIYLFIINLINKLKRTRRTNYIDNKSIVLIRIQIKRMNDLKLHRERERRNTYRSFCGRSVAEGWIIVDERELKHRNWGITSVWIVMIGSWSVAIGSWSVAIGVSSAFESSQLGVEASSECWSVMIRSWSVANVWIVAKDESATTSWVYGGDGRRSVTSNLECIGVREKYMGFVNSSLTFWVWEIWEKWAD